MSKLFTIKLDSLQKKKMGKETGPTTLNGVSCVQDLLVVFLSYIHYSALINSCGLARKKQIERQGSE